MPPFVPDFTRLLTSNSTLEVDLSRLPLPVVENRDPLFYRMPIPTAAGVARKRRHAPAVIHRPLVHSFICIFIYSLVWN